MSEDGLGHMINKLGEVGRTRVQNWKTGQGQEQINYNMKTGSVPSEA